MTAIWCHTSPLASPSSPNRYFGSHNRENYYFCTILPVLHRTLLGRISVNFPFLIAGIYRHYNCIPQRGATWFRLIGLLPSVISLHYMQNMVCRLTGWPQKPSMISKRLARQTVQSGWKSKGMIRMRLQNARVPLWALLLWKSSGNKVVTEIECARTQSEIGNFREIFPV